MNRGIGSIPRRIVVGAFTHAFGQRAFSEARSLVRMASREDMRLDIPWSHRISAWRSGFTAANAAIYGLHDVDRTQYLPDYAFYYRCGYINPIPQLFDQKLVLRRVLRDHGFAQAETIALVTAHGVILDPLENNARHISKAEFERILVSRGGGVISKPQNGRYGQGIDLLDVVDGQLIARNRCDSRPYSIVHDTPPNTLFEGAIPQHEFWQSLSPSSFNTLRILTLWIPGEPEPFIARAVQRMGTVDTLPTDNWDRGGLIAAVDPETGTMQTGRINRFKTSRPDVAYPVHPDTGAPIEGMTLPFWDEIARTTLSAARSLPYAPYIGWDVGVDISGTPVIVEGNKNPGLRTLQFNGGLLANPRIRRFYASFGVI